MRESDIQTKLKHFFLADKSNLFGGFELKVVRGKTFRLSQLEENQRNALELIVTSNLYYKLSDVDFRKKPFDFFVIPKGHSFLIVYFSDSKLTYFCNYKDIMKTKKETFTEEELDKLSFRTIKLW